MQLTVPSVWTDTAAAPEEDPPPKDKFFSCAVAIKGLQKFLTCYLVGSVAVACE